MNSIYLDNAAATRPLPCAMSRLNTVLGAFWANPNSEHTAGETARAALDEAEAKIRACIGAKTGSVHFFRTATAAVQTAIYSAIASGYRVGRKLAEHKSVLSVTPVQTLAEEHFRPNGKRLHCQMLANNETGEIYDKPAGMKPGDLWLCDATAAMGHIPIDVEQLGATYVAADAIKFGGIPGAAFLWIADGAPFIPLIEGGTQSVALIAAMADALEWHTRHMSELADHARACTELFINYFSLYLGGWAENSPENRLPHILNLWFTGADGKALSMLCSKRGVMISAGAACTSGDNAPSHVLTVLYGEQRARESVRLSVGRRATAEDCENAAKIIADCVRELRKLP